MDSTSSKIKLKNTTLFSVIGSEEYFINTIKAVQHCMSLVDFEDIKIASCVPFSSDKIKCLQIKKLDKIQYSHLFLYHLKEIIDTDFCLNIQSDGFIIDGNNWNDDFFQYDYIGAPWLQFKEKNCVGNGGFSLRSKKFIEACSKLEYNPKIDFKQNIPKEKLITPEDWFCCVHSYEKMISQDIKFADIHTAYSFSVEHPSFFKKYDRNDISTYKSFGFHGNFNTAGMKLL